MCDFDKKVLSDLSLFVLISILCAISSWTSGPTWPWEMNFRGSSVLLNKRELKKKKNYDDCQSEFTWYSILDTWYNWEI